jgi:hypothetical protein
LGTPFSQIVVYFGGASRTGLGDWQRALARGAMWLAKRCWVCLLGRWFIVLGQAGLVALEQALQYGDGGFEVIAELQEKIDVVEVFAAKRTIVTHAKLTTIDPTRVSRYYLFPFF